MAEALLAPKRRRSTVCASITKLEARIIKQEDKGELSASEHLSIQLCIETLEYKADFRKHCFALVELIDEAKLVYR